MLITEASILTFKKNVSLKYVFKEPGEIQPHYELTSSGSSESIADVSIKSFILTSNGVRNSKTKARVSEV